MQPSVRAPGGRRWDLSRGSDALMCVRDGVGPELREELVIGMRGGSFGNPGAINKDNVPILHNYDFSTSQSRTTLISSLSHHSQVTEAISRVFEEMRYEPCQQFIAAGDPMEYVYLITQVT